MKSNAYKHNYGNPLYNSWKDMRRRCNNPERPDYKWYGGKGITVCQRWETSFEAFCQDMLPSWFEGATLDRKDNTKDYCLENCRWATRDEQALNRGNVKRSWEKREEVQRLAKAGLSRNEIAVVVGLSHSTVGRLIRGEGSYG